MNTNWNRLGLEYNPFEPAASGAPVRDDLWIPERWKSRIEHILDTAGAGTGVKAIAIDGEYGSGKTYVLKWLEQEAFPKRRIKPFYFDNPGVQFYYLANLLLRQLGRYEFSKSLWEYIKPELRNVQLPLPFPIRDEFTSWLYEVKRHRGQERAKQSILEAIRKTPITDDEEIAYRFATIMVETLDKPFFEYRDFVAGRKTTLVAETEEAKYFSAIIKTLNLTSSVEGIAFLLDEFEEISLQKRLTKKQAHDYLATLKRLLNVAKSESFWLVVSLTPKAAEVSQMLEPALWERFTSEGEYQFAIPPLSIEEANQLLQFRLNGAQLSEPPSKLWPFPDDVAEILDPVNYSSPRHLVKIAFYTLAEAVQQKKPKLPIPSAFVKEIEAKIYPFNQNEA